MRKKFLVIILLSSLFLLAACGEKETESNMPTTDGSKTEEGQIAEIPEAAPEELEIAETPEAAPEVPKAETGTTVPSNLLPLEGIIVCVDAGHGLNSYNKQEAIAPNVTETKIAFASGTQGATYTEEQLNLIVAKKLEAKLQELGATVYMTRTEAASDMTNIDRAEFANEVQANVSVKIHADGNDNSSVQGISMLVPANTYIQNEALCQTSREIGTLVLNEVIKQTGGNNRGVVERSDLTGFNWTKVPIILLEMGFMSNPQEDAQLSSDAYQNQIVQGIADGLVQYFAAR